MPAAPDDAPGPVAPSTTVEVAGRQVGLRWFGAAVGPGVPVVVSCHGGLSCGLDAAPAHGPARDRGPADATALGGPAGADIDAAVAAGTTSLDGMVEEYRAWARDWGFAPSEVGVPVTVWQGDADRWVRPELGAHLAASVPGSRLRTVAGAGHLLLLERWRQVLDDLLA